MATLLRRPWSLARAVVAPYCTEAGLRALRNLVGIAACTGLGNLCAAATLFLMTSRLSPAAFGAFVVMQTVQSYLLLLSCGGTLTVTIREAARYPDCLDAITTAHLVLNVGTALLLGLLAVAASWLLPLAAEERWLLAILLAGNVAAAAYPLTLFDLHHRQWLGSVISLAGEILGLIAMGLLAWHDVLRLSTVGLVFAGKWVAVSAGQAATYHLAVHRFRWRLCGATLRTMFRSAWPTALAALVALVPLNAGIFFVRVFRGEDEAGLYGLAYQVAAAYQLFAGLGTRILQPHIVGPYGFDHRFLVKLVLFASMYIAGIGILAFLGGYLLITWFLQPYYEAAVPPLGCLIFTAGLGNGLSLVAVYFVRLGRERFILVLQVGIAVGVILGSLAITTESLAAPGLIAVAVSLLGLALAISRFAVLLRRTDDIRPSFLHSDNEKRLGDHPEPGEAPKGIDTPAVVP